MRDIRFRLIFKGKIVGYERHRRVKIKNMMFMHQKIPTYSTRVIVDYSKDNIKWTQYDIEHDDKEQFTGIPDKNGKEIYEGDTVRVRKIDLAVIVFGNNIIWTDCYNVEVKTPCFAMEWDDGSGYGMLGDREDLEIIGNIHENPELLKE